MPVTHQGPDSLVLTAATPRSRYLPAEPSPLIGRAEEILQARHILLRDQARLITLTGPAGAGKTRLAVAVAREVLAAFAAGACFVDLAPLNDPGQVIAAIARALDIHEIGDAPLLNSIQIVLGTRDLL